MTYYALNRERALAVAKRYYWAHRKKRIAYQKQYYRDHREKVLAHGKAWLEKPENYFRNLERSREYARGHREKMRVYARLYFANPTNRQIAKERALRNAAMLSDGYVAALMKVPIKQSSLDVLEAKRAIVMVKRIVHGRGITLGR